MPLRSYQADFLREALESVLRQTSPRWELCIIVEQRNLGKFKKILAETLDDERVHLVVNNGRKLAGAFNTGMSVSKTDFTSILLADDLWAPQAVEVLENAIERHPEADFFHSSRRFIDESGAFISSIYPSRDRVTLEDFRKGAPIKHLLCWRREMAIRIGGLDESLNSVGPDDFDFPWTMAEHGANFQPVPECLYFYREHDECFRLTTGLPLSVHKQEIRRILRKHGLSEAEVATRIEAGLQGYLKQCIYKSRLDRWMDKLSSGRRKPGYRPGYK